MNAEAMFKMLIQRQNDQWLADAMRVFGESPTDTIAWATEFIAALNAKQTEQSALALSNTDEYQALVDMLTCIGLAEVLQRIHNTD